MIAGILEARTRLERLAGADAAAASADCSSDCLEKDPKRRLRDIADTRLDLEDVQSARAKTRSRRDLSLRGGWVALLSSTMLALTLAGASWLLRRDSAPSLPIGECAIATQLTNYDGSEGAAAIAPDGRSFAFVSSRGGRRTSGCARCLVASRPVDQ